MGEEIENLGGWLTTVVGRVCLNIMRSRRLRGEVSLEEHLPEPSLSYTDGANPEDEALLADSVGLALQVILDALAPAERVAFVLHDMFAMPFDEIAAIVGRSPAATRQLASRARRWVQGAAQGDDADLGRQRVVVEAFLAAARDGDFEALLAVLDPEVMLRADRAAVPSGMPAVLRGAAAVARGAVLSGGRARTARLALVDGAMGAVWAPDGQVRVVLSFTIRHDKIAGIDVVADPERLDRLDLAFVGE